MTTPSAPRLEGAHGVWLVLRFVLELALLAAAGYGAWAALPDPVRWLAVVVVPIGIAALWGLVLSPRARVRLPEAAKVGIEAALFGGAGVLLALAGHPIPAALLAGLWLLDRVALRVTRPSRAPAP